MNYLTFHSHDRKTDSVPIISSLDAIKNLGGSITSGMKAVIRELIESEACLVAYDVARRFQREHREALAKYAEIIHKINDTEARLTDAGKALESALAAPGSLIISVIYWVCSACALICEFFLTNSTLPFALDLDPNSYQGLALSLAPAVAFIIVEQPIERLAESAWRKSYMCFLMLLLVANICTAGLVAMARHEVARWLQAVAMGEENIAFDDAALNRAILAISLVLVLDGALFLYGARREGSRWWKCWTARNKVAELRSRANQLRAEEASQLAVVESCQTQVQENQPELIARDFKKAMEVELEKLELVRPTSQEIVENAMGLGKAEFTSYVN